MENSRFSAPERDKLLKAYQVGLKVIERLEQVGIESFKTLSKVNIEETMVKIAFYMNNFA